ncbi:hypothetical protein AGMMS49938_11860 [Fibrobacterales bacterium]|nr:hypothetical protein AGMMS49938_11860 [Fibrobacterales bacterium]
MFMLAATIASTIVFRLLGSENFASGARLKQSEAYQASESGLDATRAWLTNRAADVGALITRYEYSSGIGEAIAPKPVHLTGENGVLGVIGGNREQKFEVYLMGVDTKKYAPTYKLKFLSVGEARDGSKVTQTAIFSVNGLYKVDVPTKMTTSPPTDFGYAYFGGSTSFSGSKTFGAMAVNGDWVKNPPTVKGDFVITGSFKTDGSDANVEGTLCVGKELNRFNNAKLNIKDVFFGTASNLGGTLEGSVYAGGDFTLSNNGELTIEKSLHAVGNVPTTLPFTVKGNLALEGSNAQVVGSSNTFAVCDSVWSNNPSGVAASAANGANVYFNSDKDADCVDNTDAVLAFDGAVNNAGNANANYKTQPEPPVGYFYSPRYNTEPTTANKPSEAQKVKDYCDSKWMPVPASCGTTDSKYVIENPIAISLGTIKNHCESHTCVTNYIPNDAWTTDLNKKYAEASVSDLYNGYLVVNFNYDQNAYQNSETKTALDGKFIFIYGFDPGKLPIPPTKTNSSVMLFLEKGLGNNGELKSAGCNDDGDPYNYFIYSLKSIATSTNWYENCPLKGSLFFPTNECGVSAGGLINADDDFFPETNDLLIRDLMTAGILCNREKDENGRNKHNVDEDGNYVGCTEQEISNTQNGIDGGSGDESIESKIDPYYIPVASRLAVKLESKEISREIVETDEASANAPTDLQPSILVMPRVVRIATNEFEGKTTTEHGGKLRDYYTFMYQNGATPSDTVGFGVTLNCVPGTGALSGNSITSGLYECVFTGKPIVSNFYVLVEGKNLPKVKITPPSAVISKIGDNYGCETISLVAPENTTGQTWTVNVILETNAPTWRITPKDGCTGSAGGPYACIVTGSSLTAFEVCPDDDTDDGDAAEAEETLAPGIVLKIESCQGGCEPDYPPNDRSIITREMGPQIPVQRLPLSDEDFPTGAHRCPDFLVTLTDASNGIANITCTNPRNNGIDKWFCKDDGQTGSWIVNTITGCTAIDGHESGTLTLPPVGEFIEGSDPVKFYTDLTWKSYDLSIKGATATLTISASSNAGDLSEAEKSFTCIGSSEGTTACAQKIYHGVTYTITGTNTAYAVTCEPSTACKSDYSFSDGKVYLYETYTIKVEPTGNVTITLNKDAATQTLVCSESATNQVQILKEVGSVKSGDLINPSSHKPFASLTGIGACPESEIKYYIGSDEISSGGLSLTPSSYPTTYTVRASLSESSNTSCSSISEVANCGEVSVVNKKAPNIECNLLDKTGEKTTAPNFGTPYTSSDLPQLYVGVEIGSGILECNAFEILGPGYETFLEDTKDPWDWYSVQEVGTANLNKYTFSAQTTASGNYGKDLGPQKEIMVRATCEGGTTKTEYCKGVFSVNGSSTATATVACNWGNQSIFEGQPLPTLPTRANVTCSGITPIVINNWKVENSRGGETVISGNISTPTFPGIGSFLDYSDNLEYFVEVSGCGTLQSFDISHANEYVSCGTLKVNKVPEIVSCEVSGKNSKTIVLNDPSKVCSDAEGHPISPGWTEETWTASKGGAADATVTFPLAKGTYSNFSLTAKCGGRNIADPYPTVTCTGTDIAGENCEYTTALCGGIPLAQVKKGNTTNVQDDNDPYCWFFTEITNLRAGAKVNGSSANIGCNPGTETYGGFQQCPSGLPAKIDGGYYIYNIGHKGNGFVATNNNTTVNGLSANCQ